MAVFGAMLRILIPWTVIGVLFDGISHPKTMLPLSSYMAYLETACRSSPRERSWLSKDTAFWRSTCAVMGKAITADSH